MTDVQTSDPVADQIIKALQDVIDPELGIDLVNLGLIYGVDMTAEGVVTVRMTLTTMGCPITDVLQQMIDSALRKVEGVKKVQIEVVWEPAWTPDRMSRFAKIALGYHG
ncbi:DNA methyltransferase [Limosilactobacillus reuteri]|jgi:Predicted metal-sulfur cluster biosynthetic enzyme|uniref:DNA methyltransferase n=1 Tax=Limosilactobacillus reuteri TaxID=1598 RepID=A0A1Y2UL74_LIMRT|nr:MULTISPECIES: metal-sulfur cluster assembly factor [Lactobacillaceae]GFI59435.1 Fe-S protein maturation auxiliary factor SufT [Lactobacillaceae bacterium]MBB1072459.1 metal-sulfur cluster assembly factor [Limosilactobacillus reuteri]MBC6910442.1 metal-sulfur cluster assembly factor [Limosilactobacillus reuteri]MBU5283578.1 metal-sulfur cluster assembly factor [Limosilactobacillus reuteri]MCC4348053.1 metal-sulfur cluster assembly factor [Limosilactobacillus reuteri]